MYIQVWSKAKELVKKGIHWFQHMSHLCRVEGVKRYCVLSSWILLIIQLFFNKDGEWFRGWKNTCFRHPNTKKISKMCMYLKLSSKNLVETTLNKKINGKDLWKLCKQCFSSEDYSYSRICHLWYSSMSIIKVGTKLSLSSISSEIPSSLIRWLLNMA